MKKFIMILALIATSAFAEPSFNQIQDLIGRQQYSAAAQGLEQIIHNHPNSAKAFYSMAQAQAGLGNLDKARYALDKATGLDPTLNFASESQVQSLREALTPQVGKIERVEESHFGRNLVLFGMFVLFAAAMYFLYSVYARKRDEEGDGYAGSPTPKSPSPNDYDSASPSDKAYMREHNLVPKAEIYKAKSDERKMEAPKEVKVTPAPVYYSQSPAPQPVAHTTVVNNSSNDGLLTGMILGNMMSDHHHHDHIIEREVVREVPVKSSESSSSRSSSWDSDDSSSSWSSGSSSSSRSSSWDSDSSSSSSSWSSSSDSSSSWDSGSSSSSWD